MNAYIPIILSLPFKRMVSNVQRNNNAHPIVPSQIYSQLSGTKIP